MIIHILIRIFIHLNSENDGVGVMEQCQFQNDGATLTLEWNKTDPTYSYQVTVIPNLPLNSSISTRVHIKVPYNSPHNVSIVVSSCGKHNTTFFFKEVHYIGEFWYIMFAEINFLETLISYL